MDPNSHKENNEFLKKKGVVIAFDLGKKKIGVAVGNNLLNTSENLKTLYASNKKERFNKIKKIIDEWKPIYIILGYPSNKDGSMNEMSKFSLNIGKEIENKLSLSVIYVNENFSSTASENFIKNNLELDIRKNNDLVDQIAADIILQSHLEEQKAKV